MDLFKKAFHRQLWQPYRDTSRRGHGNRAARRAIRTRRGKEHLRFVSEPINTDRPAILRNGTLLLIISRAMPGGPSNPHHHARCDQPEKWFPDVRNSLYTF
jgi:hypothetical protein